MIKNVDLFAEFERNLLRREPADWQANLRLFDAMHKEVQLLGILPSKNPLENIQFKIAIAKALNV